MTLKEIDNQINILQQQRRELAKQEREEFRESAKANIGRCFKVNGVYAKVLNIPQVIQHMTYIEFNQYQYPAIYLKDIDGYPFEFENLFSGAWGIGDTTFNTYEEITQEEFNAEFDKRMDEFIKRIKKAGN